MRSPLARRINSKKFGGALRTELNLYLTPCLFHKSVITIYAYEFGRPIQHEDARHGTLYSPPLSARQNMEDPEATAQRWTARDTQDKSAGQCPNLLRTSFQS